MTIIVTGAAGFIGSNLVKALNLAGERQIIAVDELTDADKFKNLVDCEIADYLDKDDFIDRIEMGHFGGLSPKSGKSSNGEMNPLGITAILHQGACSDTMETDGRYMMDNNFRYSRILLGWAQRHKVPFLYASSAAVYGGGRVFREERSAEAPLNVYGYSKFLFDQTVRPLLAGTPTAPIVGFRYFNVYGPREQHKGRMASVAFHHFNQYLAEGKVKLFDGYDGWKAGQQERDFVSVEDVTKVVGQGWQNVGDAIYLLGSDRASLAGSEYLASVIGEVTGRPQSVDFELERKVQFACRQGITQGLIQSAHDCSDGGLAVAIAESCISGKLTAQIQLTNSQDLYLTQILFGEGASRIIVSVKEGDRTAWEAYLTNQLGNAWQHIGNVSEATRDLEILVNGEQAIALSLSQITQNFNESIPKRMGHIL